MDTDKQKDVIKVETTVKFGLQSPNENLEKRRAAIKAALHAATSGLVASTSGVVAQRGGIIAEDDGGTPPWGEVIIEPIWYEKGDGGGILREAAELSFWIE